jgi:hypothetical protein
VSITGKPFMSRGTRYLIITSVIDNVGTVRQTLEQRGTGVRISVLEDKGLGSGFPVSWSELTVLAVFEKQQWLEPSEKVTDVLVVKIPSDRAAIKVEIRVITKPKIGPRNLEWSATTVLELNESSWTDPGLETD